MYALGIADSQAGWITGTQPYAGISLTAGLGSQKGSALVSGVIPGSPADDAGIQDDDQILAISGHAITSPADVTKILSACQPGQIVEVEILRRQAQGYVRLTLTLTLGYRPI
jgi:S1-C subfamily serine protease